MATKAAPIPLKLQIDMVPLSSWGLSLRNSIKRSQWDKLRKEVHAKNGDKCEICGSPDKLHCHEHWEFDEVTGTQRLSCLGTVCSMCHFVSHMGRPRQLAAAGHLDMKAVIDHFLKVNAVDLKVYKKHEKDATALFMKRSETEWKVDFGQYASLVPQ